MKKKIIIMVLMLVIMTIFGGCTEESGDKPGDIIEYCNGIYIEAYELNGELWWDVIVDDCVMGSFTNKDSAIRVAQLYVEKLKIGYVDNELFKDTKICIYDRNGTVLFSGDYTNETLLNTSLNLNMTFRQFIFIISPYFNATVDVDNVYEQIAEQLSETITKSTNIAVNNSINESENINTSTIDWEPYYENETRLEDILFCVSGRLSDITYLIQVFDLYIDNWELKNAQITVNRLQQNYDESETLLDEFFDIVNRDEISRWYYSFYAHRYMELRGDLSSCRHNIRERNGLMNAIIETQ